MWQNLKQIKAGAYDKAIKLQTYAKGIVKQVNKDKQFQAPDAFQLPEVSNPPIQTDIYQDQAQQKVYGKSHSEEDDDIEVLGEQENNTKKLTQKVEEGTQGSSQPHQIIVDALQQEKQEGNDDYQEKKLNKEENQEEMSQKIEDKQDTSEKFQENTQVYCVEVNDKNQNGNQEEEQNKQKEVDKEEDEEQEETVQQAELASQGTKVQKKYLELEEQNEQEEIQQQKITQEGGQIVKGNNRLVVEFSSIQTQTPALGEEEIIIKLKKEIQRLKQEHSEERALQKEKNQIIYEQLAKLQSDCRAMAESEKASRQMIKQLQQRVKDAQAAEKKVKAGITVKQSELQNLKQKEGKVTKEFNNLQDQHRFLKEENKNLKKRISDISQQSDSHQSKAKSLNSQLDDMKALIEKQNQKTALLQKMREALNVSENNVTSREKTIKNLSKTIEEMQTNEGWLTEVKNKEIKALQIRVSELEKQIKVKESQEKKEQKNEQEIEELLSSLKRQNEKLMSQNKELSAQNEEIKQNTSALLSKLEAEKLEQENLVSQFESRWIGG